MGTTFCPSLPHKPKSDMGKDQAGSRPAGRQTGLTKLAITSQKFQGPLGVAPPRLAPLHTGSPRQQVLAAPLPFHLVIIEQAKGPGRADPGPDAWRSIQFPRHCPLVAMMRLQVECSL